MFNQERRSVSGAGEKVMDMSVYELNDNGCSTLEVNSRGADKSWRTESIAAV